LQAWAWGGTPIDLSRIEADAYLVAGVTDHMTPWQGCYRTRQLLGPAPGMYVRG
jgi:poly(3-hydroxyalkanoate) synthetase